MAKIIHQRRALWIGIPVLILVLLGLAWSMQPASVEQPTTAPVSAQTASAPVATVPTPATSAPKIIAWYFHTTYRCYSCNLLEERTRTALQTHFAKALQEGRMEFRSVDVQVDENKHIIEKYRLTSKGVMLSLEENGKEVRYQHLPQVWRMVSNPTQYNQYLEGEVRKFAGDLL